MMNKRAGEAAETRKKCLQKQELIRANISCSIIFLVLCFCPDRYSHKRLNKLIFQFDLMKR